MTQCKANEGTQRVNMEINHSTRQKQKVFARPIIYEVKKAIYRRKKIGKCPPIKQKTVIKRNGTNKDTATGFIVNISGTKTYKPVKIKDRFPDEWNGRSPFYYMIKKRTTYKTTKIDDRYPDEWNGHSPSVQ